MEETERTRVQDTPRSERGREWEVFVRADRDGPLKHVGSVTAADAWEVFVRADRDGPLKHVGSVTAADADGAHERASDLFAWTAEDVWLCPADETRRYTTHTLGEESA